MFVNISPSIFDTEVTNRSFKFAYKTGRIKTKKVDHAVLKIQKARTLEREERFEKNNLKLLKCSPVKEAANYKVIYPETQEEINELLQMGDRNHIDIQYFNDNERMKTIGLKFKYKNDK